MRLKKMTQQTQTVSANNKISSYLTMIMLVVLALSLVALFVSVQTYIDGDQLTALIFAGIGSISLAICLFLLYQSRKQAAQVKIDIPKVMTTIECQSKECGSKTVREFERGDYVFKDLDVACSKCSGKQMITAIYKEVKEKEKTYAV
jgi:hypothetical protein